MSFQVPVTEAGQERERRGTFWGVWAAALLYAWIAAGFDSFTPASALAVGLPGVAGVLVASSDWPADRAGSRRRPSRTALVWALWFVTVALWEAFAFLKGSTPAHPTISVLLDPPLEIHVVRALAFLGWLSIGWRLLRR